MNSLFLACLAAIFFYAAYKIYARKLELIWQVDPKRSTPAFSRYDSLDYVPAKNWLILFGHHFSSIAGAGPIIGPVIAVAYWGWLPAFVWVVLGTIFIGGLHDFGSLITSVREEGRSVADIAKSAISHKAKIVFSLFVWFALILVIAVFAYLCADTFVKEPKIVLPSLGLIPVAIAVGYLLYNTRLNVALTTIIGLIFLTGLIIFGNILPVKADIRIWLLVLFIYCYLASILPVNILLQPRDYLSSFLLFFGVSAGFTGLIVTNPKLSCPAFTKWSGGEGTLWPMLFVIVACGAVSGFHSLIASGTTSKQIANENQAKRIGYGGMVAEGLVAVLAVISAGIVLNANCDSGSVLKDNGPIAIFSQGFGWITQGILGRYGAFIAATVLNAFILTTLDTATRISRYLTEELFPVKNRYISTLIIIGLSLALAYSGKWQKIWPAFGASNQLVACLALIVLSCWLLARGKPVLFTLLPAIFMLFTALGALAIQAIRYISQKDFILFAVVIILFALTGFMVKESLPVLLTRRKANA